MSDVPDGLGILVYSALLGWIMLYFLIALAP